MYKSYTHEEDRVYVWLVYFIIGVEFFTRCKVSFISKEDTVDKEDKFILCVDKDSTNPLYLSSMLSPEYPNLKNNIIYHFDSHTCFPDMDKDIRIVITRMIGDNDHEVLCNDANYDDLLAHTSATPISSWEVYE